MALLFVFLISYSLFFPISFPQYCFNGFLAECDAFVKVFSGDVERRVEVDDVAQRTQQQTVGKCFFVNFILLDTYAEKYFFFYYTIFS